MLVVKMKLVWMVCFVAYSTFLVKKLNAETLTIEGNEYTELPQISGKNITTIEIYNTSIITIEDEAFGNVRDTLETVIIEDNKQLETIENRTFYGLKKLKNLIIASSNALKNLDDDLLKDLINLQRLEIRYSRSVRIIPNLDNLENLETLNLADAGIMFWNEDTLSNNKKLTSVVLSENSDLTVIPRKSFSKQTKLKKLHFDDCSLSTLYPDYFDMTDNWEKIIGTGNPWDCDTMCEFVRWKYDEPDFRRNSELGTCAEPEDLQGILVIILQPDDVCESSAWEIVGTFLALCLLAAVSIGICWFCAMSSCCCLGVESSSTPPRRNQTSPNHSTQRRTSSFIRREEELNRRIEENEATPTNFEENIFEVVVDHPNTDREALPSYDSLKFYNNSAFQLDEDCEHLPPPPAYDESSVTDPYSTVISDTTTEDIYSNTDDIQPPSQNVGSVNVTNNINAAESDNPSTNGHTYFEILPPNENESSDSPNATSIEDNTSDINHGENF